MTGGERCDLEGVTIFPVATTGSDLPAAVVLVAELVELVIRKPVTKTTTTTTTEQTYFIRYLVVILKDS